MLTIGHLLHRLDSTYIMYMYIIMYMYTCIYIAHSKSNVSLLRNRVYHVYTCRAKNNVRTTVNFRANNGKDRSNDYTSGHYDRPGEYSALNRLIIYAIVRCPYGASAAIDRSIARTYVRAYIHTCVHVYIYIYIVDRCVNARTYVA